MPQVGGAGHITDEARAVVATLKSTVAELEAARADKAARAPVLGIDRARVLAAIEARTPAAVNFQADAVAGAMRALYAAIAEIPEGPGTALAIRLKGWERDQVIAWARATERAGEKNARRNEWLAALALLDVIDGARDHHAVPCHSGVNGEDHDGPIRDWRCVACGEEIVGPDPAPCTRPHEAQLERPSPPALTRDERARAIGYARQVVERMGTPQDIPDNYPEHALARALLDVDAERALLGAVKLWKDEDPESFREFSINGIQRETLRRCCSVVARKKGATRDRIVAELRRAEPQIVATHFTDNGFDLDTDTIKVRPVKLKPTHNLDPDARRVVANVKRAAAKKRGKRRGSR